MVPLMARRGRMVVMAGRQAQPVFPVGPFYVKDLSLLGFAMFNATPDEQRRCAEDINRWLAEKKLHPSIGRTMPLSEAAAAHRLQEENTHAQGGNAAGKDRADAVDFPNPIAGKVCHREAGKPSLDDEND